MRPPGEHRTETCSVHLLLQAGISDALFKHSFSHEVSNAKLGEGKSGMLFFTTSDSKFMIKTLKKPELSFLFHTKCVCDWSY